MKRPQVSIIINAHNENLMLHRSLRSVARNVNKANDAGIDVEVIIVADKVDSLTKAYLDNRVQLSLGTIKPRVEYVNYGDLGLSRNHGVDVAKGEYVGNLDGDDIWSDNWIVEAVKVLQKHKRVVVHQESVISFGTKVNIWHVKSSTDPSFDARSLVEDNWWQSCMMTSREVLKEVPYRKTMRDKNFSFEDWLWNSDTLHAGIEHLAVPGTTWFYRRKETSMLKDQAGGMIAPASIMTPSGLVKFNKSHKVQPRLDSQKIKKTGARVSGASVLSVQRSALKTLAVRVSYKAAKQGMRVGKKLAKPVINRHGRVKDYMLTMKGETKKLLMGEGGGASSSKLVAHVPQYAINHWRTANELEPELFPTKRRLWTMHERQMMTMGKEQAAYWYLANEIGEAVDYLVMTPWLKTSGASLVVLRYVGAFAENHPKAKIVVFGTENVDSPWVDQLPSRVKFVKPNQAFFSLSKIAQSRVIARIMVQLQPKKLHIIHSQEGFRAIHHYAPNIALNTELYVSAFNYDISKEGMRQSAFLMNVEPAIPYITKVFTDNEWIIQDTIDIFGADEDMFVAHKMPFDSTIELDGKQEGAVRFKEDKLRVLWAARIAKQKRPDIFYEIAKKSLEDKKPYEFILYGELYGNSIKPALLDKICSLKNVRYMGGFSKGILALPLSDFDVYLSTSEGEGTPNAVIEAQAGGLTTVAPAVGGIPEVVIPKKTGLLVDDFTDTKQYVAQLDYLWKHKTEARKMGVAARDKVFAERNWDAFKNQVKKNL